MSSQKIKFLFMLPVWGPWHIKVFTKIGLPLLLTDGNLGHFRGRDDVVFQIMTNRKDMVKIEASAAGRRLAEAVPVEYVLIDGIFDLSNPIQVMSGCYKIGLKSPHVVPGYTNFGFLTPDSFWSDGSFRFSEQKLSEGYKAIMACGLRTQPTIYRFIHAALLSGRVPQNREWVSSVIANLHQISRNLDIFSGSFTNVWPSHVYWVEDDYVVAHGFHLHPLFVRAPKRSVTFSTSVDGDFLKMVGHKKSDYLVVTDSDLLMGIEISPSKKSLAKPSAPKVESIRRFRLMYANKLHDFFFNHRIIFKGKNFSAVDNFIEEHEARLVKHVMQRPTVGDFLRIGSDFSKRLSNWILRKTLGVALRLLRRVARPILDRFPVKVVRDQEVR